MTGPSGWDQGQQPVPELGFSVGEWLSETWTCWLDLGVDTRSP